MIASNDLLKQIDFNYQTPYEEVIAMVGTYKS